DYRRHEIPVHAVVERGLLVRIGHSEEDAAGLAMCVQTGRELDRQREVLAEAGYWFGHEDVPAERLDRKLDARELRDLRRPRAGGIYDGARSDLVRLRAQSGDAAVGAGDRHDRGILHERDAAFARARDVAVQHA